MQRSPLKQEILQRKRHVKHAKADGASTAVRLQAQESALWLLQRSLDLGHRRLTAQRLAAALEVGARPSDRHWATCRELLGAPTDAAPLRPMLTKAPVLPTDSS